MEFESAAGALRRDQREEVVDVIWERNGWGADDFFNVGGSQWKRCRMLEVVLVEMSNNAPMVFGGWGSRGGPCGFGSHEEHFSVGRGHSNDKVWGGPKINIHRNKLTWNSCLGEERSLSSHHQTILKIMVPGKCNERERMDVKSVSGLMEGRVLNIIPCFSQNI